MWFVAFRTGHPTSGKSTRTVFWALSASSETAIYNHMYIKNDTVPKKSELVSYCKLWLSIFRRPGLVTYCWGIHIPAYPEKHCHYIVFIPSILHPHQPTDIVPNNHIPWKWNSLIFLPHWNEFTYNGNTGIPHYILLYPIVFAIMTHP